VFHSLTEAIDTATPTGRAMWKMIGVLAELERSLILIRANARQSEGREAERGPFDPLSGACLLLA